MGSRTKLTIAYLGTGFSGWQYQDRPRTVQGELEHCLRKLTGGPRVVVVGASRTDAGVHASAQVAHIDLPVPIPVGALPRTMNHRLAKDLRVRSAVSVADDFHAIKSARGKHYTYRVSWREPELPWHGLRTAVLPQPIDIRALEGACRLLPGRRNWASFSVPEAARRSTVRSLFGVDLKTRRSGLELHFFGEGFLRYQVRRMVGALFEIGRGRMTHTELVELIDSPTPGASVLTAPARGLTLERVIYRASSRLTFPNAEPPRKGG